MKQICKACYKPRIPDYCADCRRKLFNKARISASLSFPAPQREQLSILSSYNKERTFADIRLEYALKQKENELELAEGRGSHILKVVPTGSFQRLEQLPANEQLTMQIAEQVYNIYVAPNALAYLQDESPAYLTRRIDITDSNLYINKYSLPELFEKSGMEVNNSTAGIAELLKRYLAAYKPQIEHVFALCVFNYLFSCAGINLQQFSLVENADGEFILSPAYNLLCTALHDDRDDDPLQYRDGMAHLVEGGYAYLDFYSLATEIGIAPKRAERMLNGFLQNELQVEYLAGQSFLSEESKGEYIHLYKNRLLRFSRR